jgi:hypothetical protein
LSGCKVARETAIVKKKEKKYEEDQRPETKINSHASGLRSLDSGSHLLKKPRAQTWISQRTSYPN